MALSINTSGTYTIERINAAESTTNWSVVKLEGSGGTPSVVQSVGSTDLFREGNNAVETVVNKQRVILYYTIATGVDFTSGGTGTGSLKVPNGNIYIWSKMIASGALLLEANGGLQIEYSSTGGAPTTTGAAYVNVGGSDTYDGNFVKFATTITKAPDEGSAQTIGDVVNFGIVADVGTTTTRFDNFVVDAIDVGTGLSFNGTTTTDKLFSEAYDVDETTAIGILSNANGIIFAQGSLSFDGTSQTSDSETLVFTDTLREAYTYNMDIIGTVTFNNSTVSANGAVDYDFDSSTATSFTMSGGTLKDFASVTFGSGQTVNGAVLQSGGTITVPNNANNLAVNQCGVMTLTGALTGAQFNEPNINAGQGAVSVTDIGDVGDASFTRGANGHAVEVTF